jgi:hypothetical protein
MKYELSKEEFQTIHNTTLRMVEMMCEIAKLSIENTHHIALKKLDLDERRQSFKEAEAGLMRVRRPDIIDDVMDEDSSEDTLRYPREVETPKQRKEESAVFTIFQETKNYSDHQIKGKFYLSELLKVWLVGFRKDDVEQPDRGEHLEELSRDGHRSGAIVSYAMAIGGLTKAVWNALYLLVHVQEESQWSEYLDAENVRYIAGHMCQVSSLFLQPLADEFEYPNPLAFMEQK